MYLVLLPPSRGIAYSKASYAAHVLGIRDGSTSSTTVGSSTLTSDAPFTSGSIGGSSNAGSGSGSENQESVTKIALEWVFAVAALIAIISVSTWRFAQLRRRNQSWRSFLPHPRKRRSDSRDGILHTRERRQSLPRTTGLPRPRTLDGASLPITTTLFYPPSLVHGRYPEPLEPAPAHLARSASLPAAERGRRCRRAARGADIDASGRRGGRPDSDDWDGDDKEELPAYESAVVGGPPRYADVDMQYLGGIPLRVLTLPMTVPESSRESVYTVRASRREGSTDRSRTCSPLSSRPSEPASSSDSIERHVLTTPGPPLQQDTHSPDIAPHTRLLSESRTS